MVTRNSSEKQSITASRLLTTINEERQPASPLKVDGMMIAGRRQPSNAVNDWCFSAIKINSDRHLKIYKDIVRPQIQPSRLTRKDKDACARLHDIREQRHRSLELEHTYLILIVTILFPR